MSQEGGTSKRPSGEPTEAPVVWEFALCFALSFLSLAYLSASPAIYPGRGFLDVIFGMPREIVSGWFIPMAAVVSFGVAAYITANVDKGNRLQTSAGPVIMPFSMLTIAAVPTAIIALSLVFTGNKAFESAKVARSLCNAQQLAAATFALYSRAGPGLFSEGRLGSEPVDVVLLSGTEFGKHRPTGLFADILAHDGFRTPYLSDIERVLSKHRHNRKLFVIGHSLGGIVAQLVDADYIVEFGSPLVIPPQPNQFVRSFAVKDDPIPYMYSGGPLVRALVRSLHQPIGVLANFGEAIHEYRSAITYIPSQDSLRIVSAHLDYPAYTQLARYDARGDLGGHKCLTLIGPEVSIPPDLRVDAISATPSILRRSKAESVALAKVTPKPLRTQLLASAKPMPARATAAPLTHAEAFSSRITKGESTGRDSSSGRVRANKNNPGDLQSRFSGKRSYSSLSKGEHLASNELIASYWSTNDYADVRKACGEAFEQHRSPQTLGCVAEADFRLRDYKQAALILDALDRAAPGFLDKNPALLYIGAQTYSLTGRCRMAIVAYHRLLPMLDASDYATAKRVSAKPCGSAR